MYCASSISTSNCTFSRPGVRIERQFFRFFPSPNFLPRSINGEYFLNNFIDWLIDWLIGVVIGVTSQTTALTGIRTPYLETWNLKWNWICHSKRCSNGSNSTFSRSGVRIPVRAIFPLFFLLPTFCHDQPMEDVFCSGFIDWLIDMSCHWGHITKQIAMTGVRTPDLETWNWICHSMLNCSTRSTRSQTTL